MFMLADSRHDPTADDVQMMEFLHYNILPFTVVLTKADKLSKMKLKQNIKAIAADLYLGESNLIATSSETGYGKDEILAKIKQVIELKNQADESETDDADGQIDGETDGGVNKTSGEEN